MIEINLDDLEDWYTEFLSNKYAKLRRKAKKNLEKIIKIMFDMKGAIDRMDEKDVDLKSDVAKKSVSRFVDKMRELFDSIEVPEEVTYEKLRLLIEDIKKFFMNLQPIIKQNVRKFAQEYKEELKEIDFISRKLSGEHVKLDKFMRDKYSDAKDAENLISRTDRLFQTIEKISRLKVKIDDFEKEKSKIQENLKQKEEKLIDLETQEELKRLAELDKKSIQHKTSFRSTLKFRKVLNKIKVGAEKGQYMIRDLSTSDLREYLKDPVETIISEGESHQKLTNLLVQVRYALEQGQIPIKKETKDKIIENINEIVGEEKILRPYIQEIKKMREEISKLNEIIKKAGLKKAVLEVKDEIAQLTSQKEHIIGDLENTQNQYHMALEKLKEQREQLQDSLKEETGEDIKIQITFTF